MDDAVIRPLVELPISSTEKPACGSTPRKPVAAADRRAIWKRAGGCCEYVDELSGRRCRSRWALELDHVQALARGGRHERENYRLTCKQHNLFLAVQAFGAPLMERYLNRTR
jgi:5-methylcytosine-specific restriction endonuclease McrA